MPRTTKKSVGGTRRRAGFTLIELLVVITIIALLVSILAPSVMAAIGLAYAAKTQTRINALTQGADSYYNENKRIYYPGQKDPSKLTGNGGGSYTGSQVLAAELFGFTLGTAGPTPNTKYAACTVSDNNRSSDLFDPYVIDEGFATGSRTNSISDQFGSKPMAILYFPARIGETGLTQFHEADNSAYLTSTTSTTLDATLRWKGGTFSSYITNPDNTSQPRNLRRFILIGAGRDRKYGTDDDLTNWSK